MNLQVREAVYAVLNRGLDLKDWLEDAPGSLSLPKEQQTLRHLLQAVPDTREPERESQTAFLGLRYPLVCWLDEIFITDSPWAEDWKESALEWSLFQDQNRHWRFWKQQKLVEDRADFEALEVFFLCVVLGFRGEVGEDRKRLDEKVVAMKSALGGQGRWPGLGQHEQPPETFVPPLYGHERKQLMLFLAGVSAIIFVCVGVFLAVATFGK
ncbi:MAG: DotU family type IV/VI secretion system protein [Gemmataceae bacterium]